MKTTRVMTEKPPREPRFDCRQANYSAGALLMMEQATGQRLTQLPPVVKPVVAAVDAD